MQQRRSTLNGFGATLRRLLTDDRGAMFTEYTAVTGFVAIVSLPALLYCGWALAASFGFVRNYVLYPFP
jgi:Flp pilus assembly pilin Flp